MAFTWPLIVSYPLQKDTSVVNEGVILSQGLVSCLEFIDKGGKQPSTGKTRRRNNKKKEHFLSSYYLPSTILTTRDPTRTMK